MSFIIYDLAFMLVFALAVILFLYIKRHNLDKQSWIYLYKTKFGLKLIDSTAKKYARILGPLQYVIIGLGYVLMVTILFFMVFTTYIYLRHPEISRVIKAPPIVPLIPYFPELFGLRSFFPEFNFTYFLVAIVIVAVVHEFAHGIIARFNKIKVHTTGFAFAGPLIFSLINSFYTKAKSFRPLLVITALIIFAAIWFWNWLILIFLIFPLLGAFVEQDDKQMNKASKFKQLAVLAAGVFANILFTLIFLGILWVFFLASFTPAGVNFSEYAYEVVSLNEIQTINGMPIDEFKAKEIDSSSELISIETSNASYFAYSAPLKKSLESGNELFLVYEDTPALRAKLEGTITHINKEKINSLSDLTVVLSKYAPGDNVAIQTNFNGETKTYDITLASNPEGKAYLGIRVGKARSDSILSFFYNLTPKINNPLNGVHYESIIGDFGIFIFYMLWWIVIINFFVGLFNMLPLGILDGGRFFMLTVVGITKSKKVGMLTFKLATAIILILFALMMFTWVFNVF